MSNIQMRVIIPIILLLFVYVAPTGVLGYVGDDDDVKTKRISVKEVKRWLDDDEKVLFIDVRSGGTADRIPDAIHVPLSRIDWWAERTEDKSQRIVTYCA